MKYKALLFDLDGTLIDFEFNQFIKLYIGAASQFFIDLIPNPESFINELLKSTEVMEKSDNGTTSSLDDFLNDFCPKFDVDCGEIRNRFLRFYETKYDVVKPLITPMKGAKKLLDNLNEKGHSEKIILATNPVFPYVAIERRIKWGGLSPDYFRFITHAENSYYCKYNKKYWSGIMDQIQCRPKDSLVIGNDGFRDMFSKKYGFNTFLVEDSVENEDKITKETEPDYRGSLIDLQELLFL